jgi:hypothetical protein
MVTPSLRPEETASAMGSPPCGRYLSRREATRPWSPPFPRIRGEGGTERGSCGF